MAEMEFYRSNIFLYATWKKFKMKMKKSHKYKMCQRKAILVPTIDTEILNADSIQSNQQAVTFTSKRDIPQ